MRRRLDRLAKTDEYAEAMRSTQVSDFTTNEDYRSIAASLAEFNRYPVGVLYKVPNDINNEYRRVAKFVQDRTQQINAIKAMPSISKGEKQRFEKFLGDAQFNAARLRMEMLFDALQYLLFRKGEQHLAPGVHIMLQDDFGYITPQRAEEIREEELRAGNAGNA